MNAADSRSPTFDHLAALEPLMDKCVHCGFCLPTCPSYVLLGQEMDSPRGRIYLQKAGVDGRLDMSPSFVQHFDTCLGCMACETACPSGVRYAPLVEETRATIERHHRRPLADRLFRTLLFSLLPYPGRLRVVSWPIGLAGTIRRSAFLVRLASWLPRRLTNLIMLAPDRDSTPALPEHTPAVEPQRLRVGLLTGCVQQVFFGRVNQATVNVLSAEGCQVTAPRAQGCCGALALHAGRDADARQFARQLIDVFEQTGVDRVVVNAAGCGSTMKGYGELLANDPAWAERAKRFSARVQDATETLCELGEPRRPRAPLEIRLAYHDACHLAHAQGVRNQPRTLLAQIPGLTIVPLPEGEICCGSAGIFNLVEPEMAAQLGARKAGHIKGTAVDAIATSNPGCILQLRSSLRQAGADIPVVHIMEVLNADKSLS